MKVALVCPTVGQTRRGYERFVTELFAILGGDVDVTLFKGAGPEAAREIVLPHVTRTGLAARWCGHRLKYARYRLEFATFARALRRRLAQERFDLVHFIDPPLARPLAADRAGRNAYRLLFTHAGPDPARSWRLADRVHCLAPGARDALLADGVAESRLDFVPVGVQRRRAAGAGQREALRARHAVPADAFVVLAVTTLNRHHKRVDHLIEEIAAAGPNVMLWVDAGLHPDGDPSLLEFGRRRLGTRFRHSHVGSGEVDALYTLADVLVSAALEESFGMAIVEAMTCDLPVVTHDSTHFRWLVGGGGHHVDMTRQGALAAAIDAFASGREPLAPREAPAAVLARFGWDALKPRYLEMYRSAAREPLRAAA